MILVPHTSTKISSHLHGQFALPAKALTCVKGHIPRESFEHRVTVHDDWRRRGDAPEQVIGWGREARVMVDS